MKTITICYLLFLIIISLNSNISLSQGFNSVHTSDGINVFAVGDSGKIYKSSNSGNSWYNYSYTSNNLKSVFTYGSNSWFAGDSGRVYKTNSLMNPISAININDSFNIESITFLNSNTGYVCGTQGNLYKSINGGLNWSIMNLGIDSSRLTSISFKDELNGCVVSDNGKIYTTINGGISWSLESITSNRKLLKVKYFTDGIAVVGEYGTVLIKPNLFIWSQINTRINTDIRSISGTSINESHLCGGGGFIRNNKNGSLNFLNFEINPMMANLSDIFYYNSNIGFAVSSLNKAVIKTTNAGQSWELPSGSNVTYSWVQKTPSGSGIGNNLCMHPKDRNSAFVVYGNKVYVSRDRSETWTQISTITTGTRAHSFYVSPVDTNIWMAAIESSPDNVSRSTNYGATWSTIISKDFSTYGQPLEMDQNNPSVFYFAPSNGTGNGVFKSTDNGATFLLTAPYNNSSIGQPCDLIVMWDSSNVLFMGDDGADIYKSTDYAVSWFQVKPGSSSELPSMCNSVFDKSICYATTWSSSQVFKTTNFGENWNVTSNNTGSGWASDICHEDPTLVLTGNYGSQSYLSTNSGLSFFNVNTGLSGAGAGIMVPERGYLLNMQTGSLYKMKILYSVIDSQIYVPNPPQNVNVNIKVLMEGMYYPVFQLMTRSDSVKVYLRNATSPYSIVDSSRGKIDSISFSNIFTFFNTASGSYFISVKHFNTIETWSKTGGESLVKDGSIYNYDFTTAFSNAYGYNLKKKGTKYCLFSGDVTQDGIIDAGDLSEVENDVSNSVVGHVASDVNGDDFVDADDLSIVENNKNLGVIVITP